MSKTTPKPKNTRHLPGILVDEYIRIKKFLERGAIEESKKAFRDLPEFLQNPEIQEAPGAVELTKYDPTKSWPGAVPLSEFQNKICLMLHHTGNAADVGYIVEMKPVGQKDGKERLPKEFGYGFRPVSMEGGKVFIATNSLHAVVAVRRGWWYVSGSHVVETKICPVHGLIRSLEQVGAEIKKGPAHARGKHHHGDVLGDVTQWISPGDVHRVRIFLRLAEEINKAGKIRASQKPPKRPRKPRDPKPPAPPKRARKRNLPPPKATDVRVGAIEITPEEHQRIIGTFADTGFWDNIPLPGQQEELSSSPRFLLPEEEDALFDPEFLDELIKGLPEGGE